MSSTLAQCAVIGNPISHSLSPSIHQQFAKQTGVELEYTAVKLESAQLNNFIKIFFTQGGLGLNVTAPFKKQVIESLDSLTDSAEICQSVNTIFKNSKGLLVGDTTDGAGIMLDLKRLGFDIDKQNIAIIGAGGASIPVALALLNGNGKLHMLNRTEGKVTKIVNQLESFGQITPLDLSSAVHLDGIITATSEFNQPLFEQAYALLKPDGFVYDLNYAERAASTAKFCSNAGFKRFSDGYGMLLGQAAKSFERWHGKMPKFPI